MQPNIKSVVNGHINGNIEHQLPTNAEKNEETVTTPKFERCTTLTEDAVIGNLDEILSKEEENLNLYFDSHDRKFSVDTSSVHSRTYYEENVEAVIHREDNRASLHNPESTYTIPEESIESSTGSLNEDVFSENVDELQTTEDSNIEGVIVELNEAMNNGFSKSRNSELVVVPMPPSIENFEMYKTSTMPAIKIKTVPRVKIAYKLNDDENQSTDEATSDEHVVRFGDENFDNFKSKLEKVMRKRSTLPSSYMIKQYEVDVKENSPEAGDNMIFTKAAIKSKLEDLFTKQINKTLMRSISEGAIQTKAKELEFTRQAEDEVIEDKHEISENKNKIAEDKNEIAEDKNEVAEDNDEVTEDKNKATKYKDDVTSSDDDSNNNENTLANVKKKLEDIFSKKSTIISDNKNPSVKIPMEEVKVDYDNKKTEPKAQHFTKHVTKKKKISDTVQANGESDNYIEVYGVKLRKIERI